MRLLILMCTLCFSIQGFGATTFIQDWEQATLPVGPRDTTEGIWYHGNCYSIAGGDQYNSVELSTKYKRFGNKSVRLIRKSLDANKNGHGVCESWMQTSSEGEKARNEIRYGYGKTDFQSWLMGDERWLRISYFLPTDEGNFSTWNASTKAIMLAQIFGANPSGTHEMAFILTGGPKLRVEVVYGLEATSDGTEVFKTIGYINLKTNEWNDIIIRNRRGWQTAAQNPTGYGVTKVWANCADWANCTPAIDYSGPNAVRWRTDQYWKTGPYGGVTTWDHQHVIYQDAVMMGKPDAETEAQMLAMMAADYAGGGGGTGGGGDDPPIASDLVVNAGNPIDSLQDPINFTVTNVNDITNCRMNDGDPLAVKFDYTGGTSGKFAGVDTTGFSSSGTVTCYDESVFYNPLISSQYMLNNSSTDSSVTTGIDFWGYTTGRKIVKDSATGSGGEAYWTYGSAYSALAGDRVRFDFTYSCQAASCNNMYIDIGHNTLNDYRIRLSGTAGALVLGTPTTLHGTSHSVRNYINPNGNYRTTVMFVASEANNYKIRAGWNSSAAQNSEMYLHEVVMRKNWTTTALSADVMYSVADSEPPNLSNCVMTNINTVNPDNPVDYTVTINCTTDDTSGPVYAMITTSNTSPEPADVIAATGAIRSANQQVTGVDISFEFTGMSYQDLWGWIVHCDTATTPNCSPVAGVTFDDGVGPGQERKIKFSAATKQFRASGSLFTGEIDEFVLYGTDPLRVGPRTPLVEFQDVTVTVGDFTLTEADVVSGSLTGLALGTYYYTAYTYTNGVSKFASGTIDLIAE